MENDSTNQHKQTASAFWKSYFALFRRRVGDHEVSQTRPAGLSVNPPPVLNFPERRKSVLRHDRRPR